MAIRYTTSRMPRKLEPIDELLKPNDVVRDRSELAKIYERPARSHESSDNQQNSSEGLSNINGSRLISASLVTNFLLIIPYIISFVSIAAIYSIGDAAAPGPAFTLEGRLSIILLTLPALLPWVFSICFLSNTFSSYDIKVTDFILFYSIFIFPVIKINVSLYTNSVSQWLLFPGVYILSQVYVLLLLRTLTMSANHISRYSTLIVTSVVIATISLFI